MHLRHYESSKDRHAAWRVWKEVGWVGEETEEQIDWFLLNAGTTHVAEVGGAAECVVQVTPGDVRYLNESLPLGAVTGVTTSRVARRQGLAGRLTARAIAEAVHHGAVISALGIFEQGYYNLLGFGTGSYEYYCTIAADELTVSQKARPPRRLSTDDYENIHQARLNRLRGHGSCSLTPPAFTRGRMSSNRNAFGLGYCDTPDGSLSHFIWCSPENVEHGPYGLPYLVYRTGEEFLELIALLKSLGDQVRFIKVSEPAAIQLQDLVKQPFRMQALTRSTQHQAGIAAFGWWQMRICDVACCLQQTRLPWGDVHFNLRLSDPIERFLPPEAGWRGVAGEYRVTLGTASCVEAGHDPSLPTLQASVGAFTRLWLGVRPASGLAVTDELCGPPELLASLDELMRLPRPLPDWDL